MVKKTTGGFIRSALEDEWEVSAEKEQAVIIDNTEIILASQNAKADKETKEKKWKELANQAIANLPKELIDAHFEQYKFEHKLIPHLIKAGVESESFKVWLRPLLVPRQS